MFWLCSSLHLGHSNFTEKQCHSYIQDTGCPVWLLAHYRSVLLCVRIKKHQIELQSWSFFIIITLTTTTLGVSRLVCELTVSSFFYELTISAHVVRNPASRANSVVSLISTLTRMIESTSLVFVLQFLSLLAMSHCMACCQTSKKDKMAETSEESITGQETNLLHVVDFNLCAFMINDIWKQSQLQTLNLHIPSMICIMRIMHLMADFLDQMKLM